MALRLKDSKVVHTIDSTGSGFFQIREHKLFYSSAKAVYCYDIYTKKNYKIANDDKILIFSDKIQRAAPLRRLYRSQPPRPRRLRSCF